MVRFSQHVRLVPSSHVDRCPLLALAHRPGVPMSHHKRNAPSRPDSSPAHVVQFYDPLRFPAEKIVDYFLDGLRDDEGAVMIATPDHIEMVRSNLKLHGVDGLALERAGLWFSLDAIEVLNMLREDYR